MKERQIHRQRRPRGMTLLELTIVILVLLSLITVLFIGAQAWKRGSDRTMCILHIQSIQRGVRSFSNLNGYSPGDNVAALRDKVIGPGLFVQNAPVCPGSGTYSYGEVLGTDTIPQIGQLYLKCSFSASKNHVPASYADW